MNELALSNNLTVIEEEIRTFHELGSRSVWEIGKRLNHVKENDLTHGEFGRWLKNINMKHDTANRYMKINKELNYDSSRNLGFQNLYHIALLPEKEREEEHITADGDVKTPNEMTVRELQELKKKLKEKDDQIKAQQEVINEQADAEPQIIEKIVEVEKEVQHPHVDDLRSDNEQLSHALRESQKELNSLSQRHDFIEKEYNDLIQERAEVDEKSKKYDQLTEAINNAEGELNSTQKLISDHKNVMKILRQGNEILMKVSGLAYLDISEEVTENVLVKREFDSLVNGLERLARDLRNMKNHNIIEGEFINE